MSIADKEKWDAKYRMAAHPTFAPSKVLTAVASFLPKSGAAIDLAGGYGRHSFWLAQHGLDVTLVDVSQVALDMAAKEAKNRGVDLSTMLVDLETEAFPQGPWDVALSALYFDKSLWITAAQHLRPGGILIVLQPTTKNLERHPKPPVRFLLEQRELLGLIPDLEVIHYREDWLEDGRHDALLVARKEDG